MPSSTRNIVTIAAPAKVNLYLYVTGKKEDGYHEIDTVVVFTALHDVVSVVPHHSLNLEQEGPFSSYLSEKRETNLVHRAAKALAELVGIPSKASITLHKAIPVAAGLGGGSADAAATLRALCQLWKVEPDKDKLAALALSLGADVPVCLMGVNSHVRGIGEIVKPLPNFPNRMDMVLVNPNIPLPTKSVFEAFQGPYKAPETIPSLTTTNPKSVTTALGRFSNDLTKPARTLCPVIDEILFTLSESEGCYFARLSGSGPCCFGLFDDPRTAAISASRISRIKTDWWVEATHSIGSP